MHKIYNYLHTLQTLALSFALSFTVNAQQNILINEFMAENSATIKDSDGAFSDWIEIYNPTNNTINLSGWSLTDSKETPGMWKFPAVDIMPQSYLVVFASGKNRTVAGSELHTNFKLSTTGEFLGLYNSSGTAVSIFSPSFPMQKENISYAFDGTQYLETGAPTPGAANAFNSSLIVYAPTISKKHGFYSAPFKVGMSSPHSDAPIYYTTNGSELNEKTGKLYSDSIPINTTTVLRARAIKSATLKSTITSQTYLFIDDVLKQPNNPEGYPSTWGPFTGIQGTAPADYEMDQEIVQNEKYKGDFKTAMLALPSISIVTDIKNLFSKNTNPDSGGIYIYTGAPGAGEVPELGEDWERPASVEIFNSTGSYDFAINCGLRLHGGHSRRAEKTPKHSFTLAFREKYGSSKMNYPLFGEANGVAQSFNSIILRGGFGNTWTHWAATERSRHQLIQDLWAKDKQQEMGNPSGHGIYAHLYLNGIYWGIYNPTEKLDNDFAASYLGGDKDDYDVIKDYGEIVDGDMDAWNATLAMARQGVSNDVYYRLQGKNPDGTVNSTFPAYVDVQNLADYMILNFFVSNADWDHHNWTAMRNRAYPGSGFKFFSWDAERIIESVNANITNEKNVNCPSELFQLLAKNNKFRYLFAQRVELFCKNNGILTPASCQQTWMVRSNQVEPAIIAESARWGDYRRDVHPYNTGPFELYTKEHWLLQKDFIMNTYFPNRTNAFLSELQTANLYPYRELITSAEEIFYNPDKSWLGQNYPNPFSETTTIAYQIGEDNMVSLLLYNALGKEIGVLMKEFKPKGKYSLEINALNLSPGIYYYRLILGNTIIQTKKMSVLD